MKKGKAAGIDGLTVEHLTYSHPALVSTFCSGYARFINEMQAIMTQFRLIVRLFNLLIVAALSISPCLSDNRYSWMFFVNSFILF